MVPFLTVKEAAALVEKSPSSIRRIIYPIIEADAHPDRDQIWPSVEEVKDLRSRGENFPWKLTEELLRRELKDDPRTDLSERGAKPAAAAGPDAELLAMLRAELSIKNEQISKQSELIAKHADLISGLSERLREGNVLIGTLQQRLALGDGRDDKEKPVEATVARPTKSKAEKSERSEKAEKPERGSGKTEKKPTGFFRRLFS